VETDDEDSDLPDMMDFVECEWPESCSCSRCSEQPITSVPLPDTTVSRIDGVKERITIIANIFTIDSDGIKKYINHFTITILIWTYHAD
jgi:hypothetical protein